LALITGGLERHATGIFYPILMGGRSLTAKEREKASHTDKFTADRN
jgi:hypothetical protein